MGESNDTQRYGLNIGLTHVIFFKILDSVTKCNAWNIPAKKNEYCFAVLIWQMNIHRIINGDKNGNKREGRKKQPELTERKNERKKDQL